MKTLVCLVSFTIGGALAGDSLAGNVVGRLELPAAPAPPGIVSKGFLDRTENALAKVRSPAVTPYMLVVLEGAEGDAKPESPPQVSWDLVGESFARPVVGAAVGAEIVIRNVSRNARTLVAAEDLKLIPSGPINPTGPKSFRPTEPKVYTIGDKDAPHLKGKLVVVNTKYIAIVDASGKFDLGEVPEGSYKLRVFFKEDWLARQDETVNVGAKGGKTEVSVKVPAGYPLVSAPKK